MTNERVNTADEEVVEQSRKKEKRGREREIEDLRDVLATKQGRNVLMRYMRSAGLFSRCFTGSSNQTCFNEGAREVAIKMLDEINEANPDSFQLMLKEERG